MNEYYQSAERIIKEVIKSLERLLPQDGEDISYYHSTAIDDDIIRLVNAKDKMARGEMVEIFESKDNVR